MSFFGGDIGQVLIFFIFLLQLVTRKYRLIIGLLIVVLVDFGFGLFLEFWLDFARL